MCELSGFPLPIIRQQFRRLFNNLRDRNAFVVKSLLMPTVLTMSDNFVTMMNGVPAIPT